MKFTLSWLKDFLDTKATGQEICDTLNKIGLEVDDFLDYGEKYKDFYCVQIEKAVRHPESDHLNICTVKTKNNALLTIICGAPNVKVGLKTIFCPAGCCLPNGREIKQSKIAGIESQGMMCSGKELELTEDHEGIIEVDNSIEIGTPVAEIFNLNDCLFEISITPNRAEALSVYGIARELASAGIGKIKPLPSIEFIPTFNSSIGLKVVDSNCPVFSFTEIKNIKNCESPDWLKKRLEAIGQGTRNAVVDISNYVMFSFNTPLHCYDADKINNDKVIVRPANDKEEFIDLFNEKHTLPAGATLIADDKKILCLGGILGSNSSGSSSETKRVLVECAIFDAINTAKTGRTINVQTEARYRYERGSDYNAIEYSLKYTNFLIKQICGGEISNIVKYEKENYKNDIVKILDLRFSNIKNLIGTEISKVKVLEILETSGYKVEEKSDDLMTITVPTWKNGVVVKEDIIDDIVRFYGYDNLEEKDFVDSHIFEQEGNKFNNDFKSKLFKIRKLLAISGMTEVVSYSFLRENENELFVDKNNEMLKLLNPIVEDLSYMRQNILTNLISFIKKNNNRDFKNIALFEIGNVFIDNESCHEKMMLGGVRSGNYNDKNIYENSRKVDVFDVKKDLFDILTLFNINATKLTIEKNVPKYYHPNCSGIIKMGKDVLGCFGEIHPQILKEFEIKEKVVAFEVYLHNIPRKMFENNSEKKSFVINNFQPIERSFAFLLDKKIEVGQLTNEIYSLNKEFITNVKLFDLYQDNSREQKSIAFSITIQPKTENLTKQQIDSISDKVIEYISTKYNGVLRDGK